MFELLYIMHDFLVIWIYKKFTTYPAISKYILVNKIRNLRILESPENKTPMMARIVKQQITQFPIKTEQKIRVLLKVQQQDFFDLRTSVWFKEILSSLDSFNSSSSSILWCQSQMKDIFDIFSIRKIVKICQIVTKLRNFLALGKH